MELSGEEGGEIQKKINRSLAACNPRTSAYIKANTLPHHLIITLSDSYLQPEREYSVSMLLQHFLGLDYEVIYHKKPEYVISTGEGKKIVISDSFFNRYSTKEDYLKSENIPEKIKWLETEFEAQGQVPVIYGDNSISIADKRINCGLDIFASAFFMLTRWEEYVLPWRDEHDRFPGNESLAFKNDFLNRPVVNEYVELLWNMLLHLGYKGKRKKHEFKLVPTHDIDDLVFWNKENRANLFRNLSGDLLKRASLTTAFKRYSSFRHSKNSPTEDPFYVYDYFMNLAEKLNVTASFYFIPGGNTPFDNRYDISSTEFKDIVKIIRRRKHEIGIHPSYNTYNDADLFKQELKALEKVISSEVETGRQHYLRFKNPITLQLWNDNDLKKDSTLYYTNYPGFRCGTCYEFRVFDIVNRKQLNLIEQPLLAMDVCFMKMDMEKAAKIITGIKTEVKKYGGQFVFLWHNSNASWVHGEPYKKFFEDHFYSS